jgi:ubiquinone/menaquinone biosynthesis C-methylase UbiE
MKLNRIERCFVNSPIRRVMQALVVRWLRGVRPLSAGADILEIGCGSGFGACMIAEQFAPRRLFLSDIDPRMVARARDAVPGDAAACFGFCVADAEALPFRSGAVDAVFGFGFLHHVADWRSGLREIRRVLKPHGVYYFEEYYPSLYQNVVTRRLAAHPPHDRFRSHDLRQEFQTVGLGLRQAIELKRLGILGVGVKEASC